MLGSGGMLLPGHTCLQCGIMSQTVQIYCNQYLVQLNSSIVMHTGLDTHAFFTATVVTDYSQTLENRADAGFDIYISKAGVYLCDLVSHTVP
jgi:hypothetical protein